MCLADFMKIFKDMVKVSHDDDLPSEEKYEVIDVPMSTIPEAYKNDPKFSNVLVILDNGHGVDTLGKGSPYAINGVEPAIYLKEYKWTREIVDCLCLELNRLGIETRKVCPEEKDIYLSTRYKRANEIKASTNKKCIFISIHINAAGNGEKWLNGKGWAAYTTKGQNNSDKLAECLYDAAEEILPDLGFTIRKDMSDGDRDFEENFTVIYGANMPAVLTENLFQDNVKEAEFLLTDQGKYTITEIHKTGIIKYIEKYC